MVQRCVLRVASRGHITFVNDTGRLMAENHGLVDDEVADAAMDEVVDLIG